MKEADKVQKEKIKSHINSLDGITYSDWLKVQAFVDWSFKSKHREFEEAQTLDAQSIPYDNIYEYI